MYRNYVLGIIAQFFVVAHHYALIEQHEHYGILIFHLLQFTQWKSDGQNISTGGKLYGMTCPVALFHSTTEMKNKICWGLVSWEW